MLKEMIAEGMEDIRSGWVSEWNFRDFLREAQSQRSNAQQVHDYDGQIYRMYSHSIFSVRVQFVPRMIRKGLRIEAHPPPVKEVPRSEQIGNKLIAPHIH